MVISKTTSYALRILIFMASHEGDELNAKYLYDKLRIPERYLRRLLTKLSKKGLIKSTRGRNGGYCFTRGIDSIFLSDIIDAIEGIDSFTFCILGKTDCELIEKCALHGLWEEVTDKMISTFSKTSLQDLKDRGVTG